ncbi:MAG: hypothetical protein ABID87_02765 [Chloroflexota bacterium]
MEMDKKLEMLEGELKLMKGEVKETLSSVRDYLQRAKLPTNDTVLIPASDNEQLRPVVVSGGVVSGGTVVAPPQTSAAPAATPSRGSNIYGDESPSVIGMPAAPAAPAGVGSTRRARHAEPREDVLEMEVPAAAPQTTAAVPLMEETFPEYEDYDDGEDEEIDIGSDGVLPDFGPVTPGPEAGPPTPQVNLLANLIRWVASTRQQIGPEQLPTFLEVYGVTGNLSPELKEVILQLVEITSGQEDAGNTADVWSRLILELHGILAGGGVPFLSGKGLPRMQDDLAAELEAELAEETRPEVRPLKLKIVYPGGTDGAEKEVTIDLNPEADEGEKAVKKPRSSRSRKGQVAK